MLPLGETSSEYRQRVGDTLVEVKKNFHGQKLRCWRFSPIHQPSSTRDATASHCGRNEISFSTNFSVKARLIPLPVNLQKGSRCRIRPCRFRNMPVTCCLIFQSKAFRRRLPRRLTTNNNSG